MYLSPYQPLEKVEPKFHFWEKRGITVFVATFQKVEPKFHFWEKRGITVFVATFQKWFLALPFSKGR